MNHNQWATNQTCMMRCNESNKKCRRYHTFTFSPDLLAHVLVHFLKATRAYNVKSSSTLFLELQISYTAITRVAGTFVHLKIAPNAPIAFSEISICVCYYSREILFKLCFTINSQRYHCWSGMAAVGSLSLPFAVMGYTQVTAWSRISVPGASLVCGASSGKTRSITGLPNSADHRRRICKRGLCE